MQLFEHNSSLSFYYIPCATLAEMSIETNQIKAQGLFLRSIWLSTGSIWIDICDWRIISINWLILFITEQKGTN